MKNKRIMIDSASEFGDVFDVEDALSLLFASHPLLPTSCGKVIDFSCFNVRVCEECTDQDKIENSGLKDDPEGTDQNK